MDQGQAHDLVGGLVPAVFAVVENGRSITALSVGQVGPLLPRHLVEIFLGVGPFDGSQAKVVRGLGVGGGEGE